MSENTEGSWWHTWWVPLAVGAVSVVAGILALAVPGMTLLALGLITGINLIIIGAFLIADAIRDRDRGDRTLRIVLGMLGIVGGIIAIRRPGQTLLALLLILGTWLVVSGLVDLVRAAVGADEHLALRLLGGALDVILGVFILALPGLGIVTLAVLIGVAFIVRGLRFMATGWAQRTAEHREEGGRGGAPFRPTPA